MTGERPCRIYTAPGLEIDVSSVDLIKYYPREVGLRGQGEGAEIPIAYAYVRGACVAVRGEENIRRLRAAWRAYKTWEGAEGER